MVNAIVLINCARGEVNKVATGLCDLAGVAEVYSVGGRFDLVAIVRAPSNEAFSELCTGQLAQFEGIVNTETLIAFQCFSKHDLEAIFSVGADGI